MIRIRRIFYALILVAPILAAIAASSQPASAGMPSEGANEPATTISTAVPGVTSDGVPVNGKICLDKNGNPVRGGGCWWESAIQLWYNLKQGDDEYSELNTVWSEYNGNFQDTWTDDNAWWGITWEEAYQVYHQAHGVAQWNTEANNLWTYDTTTGWDSDCGGSTLQHPGGAEDAISRAALGVLASSIGNSGSAQRAAAWLFQYLQGSNASNPVAEGLNPPPAGQPASCQATGSIAQLGGQTETWKVEQLTGGSGQAGTKASATAQYPDSDYNGVFNELYQQYIG